MSARSLAPPASLLLALLSLCACAENKVSLSTGAREYVPTDYTEVLKRWTREESLIQLSELDDKLTVTATYESWDFRWAYVVRYAADYRLTVEQRRALLERTLHETEDDHEFYVALYGTNWRWTDLSRPTSAWIVRLIDDQGSETAPAKIEAIPKPGPIERPLLPVHDGLAPRLPHPLPQAHGRRAPDHRRRARAGSACASPAPRATRSCTGTSEPGAASPRATATAVRRRASARRRAVARRRTVARRRADSPGAGAGGPASP